ncbi:MAG: biliverdin-producing heme oxygenase [Dehalococcoidia bacterium]|nr:biliverdin-producing heme oxygenase [Dehalococcoidia bacterium]
MQSAVDIADAATSFSAALRSASQAAHRRAEQSAFMRNLGRSQVSREQYIDFAAQQYFVYAILEEAAAVWRDDPLLAPMLSRDLARVPAIEEDLAHLIGDDWRAAISASEPTRAYCARLLEVCFDWAGGMVAHHYVRYMGDLSGGQIIRHTIERTLGFDATNGARFYEFDRVPDLAAFKGSYRGHLDALPWPAAERARVIEEVLHAYELNTRMLEVLGG